jgi:hypothetical protein
MTDRFLAPKAPLAFGDWPNWTSADRRVGEMVVVLAFAYFQSAGIVQSGAFAPY